MATKKKRPSGGNAGAQQQSSDTVDAAHSSATAHAGKGSMLTAALAYAARGIPVFPCRPNKRPATDHGFHDATTDAAQITARWTHYPHALIGIPTGPASGVAVLDLDVKPDKGKDGRQHVPDWEKRSTVIARTRSGGLHLYYKAEGAPRNSSDDIAHGVDTRGEGGYVIVPPSEGYTWVKGGDDFMALPPWPNDLRPKRATASTNATPGADPQAHPLQIEAALTVIPNDDLGWDEWNRIGMAVWRASGGNDAGYEAWDRYSQKSGKYDARTTRARWEAFQRSPPDRIGAGTLFFMAGEVDGQWQSILEDWLVARVQPGRDGNRTTLSFAEWYANPARRTPPLPASVIPTATKQQASIGEQASTATKSSSSTSPVHWHGEPWSLDTQWLVKGLVPETGAGLLSGQWGMFKTFATLDLAASVMTGQPFAGHKVARKGGVLFLAAEGSGGLKKRLAGLAEHKFNPRRPTLPIRVGRRIRTSAQQIRRSAPDQRGAGRSESTQGAV